MNVTSEDDFVKFSVIFLRILERCNPWPRVANRHISITTYYYYDVILIMTSRAYGARSLHSHYDVIRY